jgi:hypothetical protein
VTVAPFFGPLTEVLVKTRTPFFAVMALIAGGPILGAGCSGSTSFDHAGCMKTCETQNQCPGYSENCDKDCTNGETVAAASGCILDEANAYIACVSQQPSLCNLYVDPCGTERAAYDRCSQPYCSANMSTPGC